jgi:hypothetical protein
MIKSIEIYYDVSAIRGPGGAPATVLEALDFRNAAMEHIEDTLADAGLGEWVGAEAGMGEVNFGFDVQDFDTAEAAVRACVAGTPYANIREIARNEFDPAAYA